MRAISLEKPGPIETNPLRLIERPRPVPGTGEILVRVTPLVGALNEHMRKHSQRTQRLSIKTKAIDVPSADVALDIGFGLITVMIRRGLNAGINLKEIEAAGLMLLRAYGVPETEARRISRLPLPVLPPFQLRAAVIQNFDAD